MLEARQYLVLRRLSQQTRKNKTRNKNIETHEKKKWQTRVPVHRGGAGFWSKLKNKNKTIKRGAFCSRRGCDREGEQAGGGRVTNT